MTSNVVRASNGGQLLSRYFSIQSKRHMRGYNSGSLLILFYGGGRELPYAMAD